jgi:tetratricopeptide (TPR) repeat protein
MIVFYRIFKLVKNKIHSKKMLILMLLVVIASFSYLTIKAIYDPGIPFLKTDANADWIAYPFPEELTLRSKGFVNLTVKFTKSFELTEKPSSVNLYIKGFKEYHLWINDNRLSDDFPEKTNWKRKRALDASQFLKEGTNIIKVEVTNKCGPPALWLYSRGLQNDIKTNTSWTACISNRPAVSASLAQDCFLHPISSQFISPLDALCKKLPMLVAFFIISSAVFLLSDYGKENAKPGIHRFLRYLTFTPKRVFIICLILWTIGSINNALKIPFFDNGFDVDRHLHYVQYIIDHKSVPLANESWESYQPPLFYAVSAVILSLNRLLLAPNQALDLLKIIPFLCGIGQICLAYFISRMVFPNSETKQSLSVAAIALIPMNIYISSYFSNESLSALLMSLAILITIIILHSNGNSFKLYCFLGLVTGLALLTKFTVLTILPVIFLVLIYKLLSEGKLPIRNISLNLGMMFLLIATMAGWFYVRNWMHFGKFLVGNWDCLPNSPESWWWQDPGFHTFKYFFQFGKVFVMPYYAGTYSFIDSLYSTFWGDAFIGGQTEYIYSPPWNYEYMSVVYILAIPATLAMIVGTIGAIGNIVTFKAHKIWLLLLGSFFAAVYSIVYMNLLLPYYGQAKAFYGLGAVLPIGLIFVFGFDWLDRWMRDKKLSFLRIVLYGWFGTLILAISLSLFARPDQVIYFDLNALAKEGKLNQVIARYNQYLNDNPDNCKVHYVLASAYIMNREYDKAIQHYYKAVQLQPYEVKPRGDLARALFLCGRIDDTVEQLRRIIQIRPNTAVSLNALALLIANHPEIKGRDVNEAVRLARRACELTNYQNAGFLQTLATVYLSAGRFTEAANTAEAALKIDPNLEGVNKVIEVALLSGGYYEKAVVHMRHYLEIEPNDISTKDNLAWILATSPDLNIRNPSEAVRFAEEVCNAVNFKDPTGLDTLAAAYASNGRFAEAVETAGKAIKLAGDANQPQLKNTIDEHLGFYKQGKPYIDPAQESVLGRNHTPQHN